MNNFFIIANKQKDINLEITEQIRHHISRLGAVCNIYDQYDRDVSSIDIPEDVYKRQEGYDILIKLVWILLLLAAAVVR